MGLDVYDAQEQKHHHSRSRSIAESGPPHRGRRVGGTQLAVGNAGRPDSLAVPEE